jgi:hypothetical protein
VRLLNPLRNASLCRSAKMPMRRFVRGLQL